jgi:hypothetical protein
MEFFEATSPSVRTSPTVDITTRAQNNNNTLIGNDCVSYANVTGPVDSMCNECLDNENDCRVHDCRNVCNFNLCDDEENPNENCEHQKIIDVYKSIFKKYKAFHNSSDNPNIQNLNLDFSSISRSGEEAVSRTLWDMLVTMYDIDTMELNSGYTDSKRLKNMVKSQQNVIDSDNVVIKNLSETDSTRRRQIEINLNNYRSINYQVDIFKKLVVAIGLALIIPALVKFGGIPSNIGMMIWVIYMLIILIYAIFVLFVKEKTRDNNNFRKFNFVKPNDEEIARSRMLSEMSEKDKVKCQALAEMDDGFDPSSIDIDINEYKSKDDLENVDTCVRI